MNRLWFFYVTTKEIGLYEKIISFLCYNKENWSLLKDHFFLTLQQSKLFTMNRLCFFYVTTKEIGLYENIVFFFNVTTKQIGHY